MKMIWAVIRLDFANRVIEALDRAGIGAMTRLHVPGLGEENPPISLSSSDKPREILMIAVPDHEVAKAVTIIRSHARPERPDCPEDGNEDTGKIFVTYIEESFTIRTAGKTNRGS